MLWNWILIFQRLRKEVSCLLHEGHPGVMRMKMLARSYILNQHESEYIEGVKRLYSMSDFTKCI